MTSCTNYSKEIKQRKINIPSWLLVLYGVAVGASNGVGFNVAISLATSVEQPSCYAPAAEVLQTAQFVIPSIQNIVLAVGFLVTGWLGDTRIGHDRMIHVSLWFSWLGTLLQAISYCIQYGTCGLPANIAKYGLSSVAVVFLIVSMGGFFSNALAYGLDQLIGKSSAQIRAYVHWMVWGLFVGFQNDFISYKAMTYYDVNLTLFTCFGSFVCVSLVLCLGACYRHKFEPNLVMTNPYTLVYNVLKYAKQHKSAVNRSAFTYWEDKIPSRIDLGKHKYGGPFSESEVEDVKTLLRILVVFLSTSGLYISYFTVLNGIFPFMDKLEGATTTANGYGSFILWSVTDKIAIILVPLLELVVIPLCPKLEYFLLNPLKGLGVAYILMFLALLSMLIIDGVGSRLYNTECAFVAHTEDVYKFSFLYYLIPTLLAGLVTCMTFVFSFELICCQAPASMSGMLGGIYWFLRSIYINTGALLIFPFYSPHETAKNLTCTFWNLLLQTMVCGVGGIAFAYTARNYKERKREEYYFMQNEIEKKYEHILTVKYEERLKTQMN